MSRCTTAAERGGQRVLVGLVLRVELVEGRLADVAVGRIEERVEAAVAQLDQLALLVLHRAELHVGVGQLAEDHASATRPSRLCIASSRSSLSLSVCGLKRRIRVSSSL